jgi:hypothetical protein
MTPQPKKLLARLVLLGIAAFMAAIGIVIVVALALFATDISYSGWSLLWIPALLAGVVGAVIALLVAYTAGKNALSANP